MKPTPAKKAEPASAKASTSEEKLRSIATALDDLGALDLFLAFLENEKVRKPVRSISADRLLDLATKTSALARILERTDKRTLQNLASALSDGRSTGALIRFLELLSLLDERGLIEPLLGMLSDDETFGKIIGFLSDDRLLSILSQREKIVAMISKLDYDKMSRLLSALDGTPGIVEALVRLMELLAELGRRGLIDPLIGILEDEKMFSALINLVTSDQFLELVMHSQKLFTLLLNLADVDEELLTLITAMQTTTFKRFLAAFSAVGKEEPKPVRGAFGTLKELGNRDVSVGLGVVFQFLAKLGEEYAKDGHRAQVN